jgi:hypothetical protein
MDAPEISHVACLTQIRSVPWLEQMAARATRFNPHGGSYEEQRALIYHPDDPLFRMFRRAIEIEQSGRARTRRRSDQAELPLGDGDDDVMRHGSVLRPLWSEATELRFETVLPRAAAGPLPGSTIPGGDRLPETPTQAEQRLRRQLGQLVASQVIEDAETSLPGQPCDYHAYNAVLKRLFGKARGVMTQAELEAEIGWLERNRIRSHLELIQDDPRYGWSARQRRTGVRPGHGQPGGRAPGRRGRGRVVGEAG